MNKLNIFDTVHQNKVPIILKKYFNRYKTKIQKHNASLFAPAMLFNLGYVFSLVWRHRRQGWNLKIFKLLAQERIQISLHLPRFLTSFLKSAIGSVFLII
ncbi:unnamed protein product [Cuscuta campestris]|uniref:Uncharacterized protein n=1 Tax=Cuscuta campestris TaxID=132261 RepID=A0A484KAP4_9ASTE|nr:unnamed protein product [Cuscuta campestris]